MLRFHRSRYSTTDGDRWRVSWWQFGDRIFRHRLQAA